MIRGVAVKGEELVIFDLAGNDDQKNETDDANRDEKGLIIPELTVLTWNKPSQSDNNE